MYFFSHKNPHICVVCIVFIPEADFIFTCLFQKQNISGIELIDNSRGFSYLIRAFSHQIAMWKWNKKITTVVIVIFLVVQFRVLSWAISVHNDNEVIMHENEFVEILYCFFFLILELFQQDQTTCCND